MGDLRLTGAPLAELLWRPSAQPAHPRAASPSTPWAVLQVPAESAIGSQSKPGSLALGRSPEKRLDLGKFVGL